MDKDIADLQNDKNKDFTDWFFSANQFQEKLWSFIILFIEIFILFNHSLELETKRVTIALLFNLFFLIYFILSFRKHYRRGFKIKNSDSIRQIKNFEKIDAVNAIKLDSYETRANESIKQFKQFNGFLYFTAGLYILLITMHECDYLIKCYHYNESHKLLYDFFNYIFSLGINFASYGGALYVLKCFFIMYFPTFTDNQNMSSTLGDKTNSAWLLVIAAIVLQAYYTLPVNCPAEGIDLDKTRLLFETICSIINAVSLILLFARFELRILGINPVITFVLYLYALCQTSLPIITDTIGVFCPNCIEINKGTFIEVKTLILTLCLLGKIIFYNIVVYLYKTKRFFYYFLMTNLNYSNENIFWTEFRDNVEESNSFDI